MKNILIFYKNLLVSSKKWILFSTGLFFVAGIVGWAAFSQYPTLIEQIQEAFTKITGENPALDTNLAFNIFRQNLQSSLIALFAGAALGIVPFLIVWVNGFLLGYVAKYLLTTLEGSSGQKLLFLAVVLLPHGIFEIPIVLVSAAIGMRLGTRWLKSQEGIPAKEVFKRDMVDAVKFVPLLVVVLALAALLEVFVSGQLGRIIK